ncbi:EAL domain-containing protein [Microvirga pudoricolor]|uniref:EAL domain-containing protein n=1 Tax=Microvirga pudoricolor TaxID=2778729 RepID=UPI001951B8E6|nr:GGDEF domain-containing protein [Microvirga pudoricolor]MBM6593368.1 GGDEF domain-containing protein [Microvirga pudoricolor]
MRSSLGWPSSYRGGLPTGLRAAAYTWDLGTDALSWGPNAADALGIAPASLPRTGAAFGQLVEPGSGDDRRAALHHGPAGQSHPTAYKACYALRLGPERTCLVEDAGRWTGDAQGRPALARGLLRLSPGGSQEVPSALIRARSDLLLRLQGELVEARSYRHRMTLVAGRLEGEDESGELMGEVIEALRPLLRRGDRLDRYAPGRFALTLNSCTAADAESAMTRLLRLVEEGSVVLAETLRLGAASVPEHATEAVSLLRRAEEALDGATAEGLRFATAFAVRVPAASRCGTDPFDVIDALNGRRLTYVRQPLVDALTRQAVFHAAQARIGRPDGSLSPAGDVASVMDGPGLSLLLDGRMLELAADDLAACPSERTILPIAGATLRESEWIDMLAAHLGARPGIASRLTVGLPAEALTKVDAVKAKLDTMKALGVGLAAYGFGSGHLTGDRLRHLPVDLLVIGGPFVQAIERSPEERLYVRTLIESAHRLGMAAGAEWVEDERIARMLAGWGIDYLQGGLFGADLTRPAQMGLRPAKRA